MNRPRYRWRAAMLGPHVLTGIEHAALSDDDLIAEGRRELDRIDPRHATDSEWTSLAPRDLIRVDTIEADANLLLPADCSRAGVLLIAEDGEGAQ